MMEKVKSEYADGRSNADRLKQEAEFILKDVIDESGIKIHSISSRIKELDSVYGKMTRKDIPFHEIEDLVGLRIVCLLRSDLAKLADIVRNSFDVVSEDNKIDGVSIDAFGYQSMHFIVILNSLCIGPRYKGLHNLKAEIQLRTIAMDAWASLSHYLDYKSENDVPKELRKDFFALSGLFYVADTHFEMFYENRQQSRIAAQLSMKSDDAKNQEINFDTLGAYLTERYVDRGPLTVDQVSNLIDELNRANYVTIGQVDKVVKEAAYAVSQYEIYEKNNPSPYFDFPGLNPVGFVRMALRIADPHFSKVNKYDDSGEVEEMRQYLF